MKTTAVFRLTRRRYEVFYVTDSGEKGSVKVNASDSLEARIRAAALISKMLGEENRDE